MSSWGQPGRARSRAAALVVAVLCLITSFAHHGKAQGPTRYANGSARTLPVTIGDFDGDSRPDLATVQMGQASPSHARYWILLQFSTGLKQSIGVTAPIGGLQIASRDVNGDNRLDLVLSTAWLNQPIAVLLNDGHGNFSLHDVNAFPATAWGSEASLTSPNVQVKDALVVLTRPLTGDSGQNQAGLLPRDAPEGRVCEGCHGRSFSLAISVLGRAPPAAFHLA